MKRMTFEIGGTTTHVTMDPRDGSPLAEAKRGGIETWLRNPPKPPAYLTAETAILAMVTWIEALHAKITGPVPADVKLGWKAKADWARAWDAVSNPDVPQMYNAEMAAAGLVKYPDTQTFVARVIAKADIYEGVVADTEGLRTRVQDALEAESDPAQFEAILGAAQAEAMGMLTARGIGL